MQVEEYKRQLLCTFDESSFCNPLCGYLSLTEEEQNRMKPKPNHICLKYDVRLKHEGFHPKLMKCKECLNNEF